MATEVLVTSLALIVISLVGSARAKSPFYRIGSSLDQPVESGKNLVTVSNIQDLSNIMGDKVPKILTGSVDPDTFYKRATHNGTLDAKSKELFDIAGRNPQCLKKRNANSDPCPLNWVVDFQGTRYPSHIWKAVCNGVGTTCTASANSLPGCQEVTVTALVLYFRGIKSDGTQVWQWVHESVPVSCTCSN